MHAPVHRRLRQLRRGAGYAVAVALVIVALVIGTTSQLLPLVERHPERIAAWLSEKAGRPVSFERVETDWTRRGPLLRLDGLHIGQPGGGVRIGQAEVLVSLYAGLLPGRSFTELRLRGPSLTLQRDDDGRWAIRGLPSTGAGGDPLEYLEGLGELQVIGAALTVDAPSIGLQARIPRIDLRLRVDGRRVAAGARGWIRPEVEPLTLALQFERGSGDGRVWLDMESEDLSAWAPLLRQGGIEPTAGRGGLQAWAELRGHRVVLVTAQAQLRDLALAGTPLADGERPQAHFDELRTRARWRLAAGGWRLDAPLLRVADGEDSQVLDGLVVAGGRRYALLAERIDAAPLLRVLALTDRVPRDLRQWLADAAPEAQLSGLELVGERDGPLRAHGRLERVGFRPVGNAPGFTGLAGTVDGDGEGWELALDQASALRFDWPRGFGVVHDVTLDGTLLAWREGAGWRVGTPALRVRGSDYGAHVRGGIWFQGDGTRPWLEIAAELDDAPVPAAKKFWIHHMMPSAAVDWLDAALEGGVVTGGRGLVAGDLDDWPFTDNDGRFDASARIRDGRFQFQPDWPALEGADARVAFVGNGFEVEGKGRIGGLPVGRFKAGIADFGEAELKVEAEAAGDAARLLALLRNSPLEAEHHDTLANLEASGPAQTRFSLALPLEAGHGPARVDGTVSLDGARLAEKRWGLVFDGVTGQARYDGNGFAAERLDVRHRDQPGVLSLRAGRHVRDPLQAFEAELGALLDAGDLLERAPELEWLEPLVRGRSDWTVAVAMPLQPVAGSEGVLQLRSDLVGTVLDLPSPLDKAAPAPLPTRVRVGLPLGSGGVDVAFGQRMALRARSANDQTGVRVTLGRGTVAGEPPVSGMVVDGRTASLDALEWIALAKGDGADDGGVPLRQIDVMVDELKLLGGVFPASRLRLLPVAQGLDVNVDGPALAGHVSVPSQSSAPVRGHFTRLHWQAPAASEPATPGSAGAATAPPETPTGGADAARPLADDSFDPASIPPLQLDIDDLRYQRAELGRAVLRTRPVAGGLRVDTLELRSDWQSTDASGEWIGRGAGARTRLAMQVESQDMGRLVNGLGYADWLARGDGRIAFDASWPGSPAGFSLGGLQGSLRIDARNGQLLEIEPGAGRVLGLLSVAQLPRRLMLDFRDFFSKGFAFNHLEGNVRFADGAADTDDMRIDGPAADIHIRGRTDLRAQQFDQTIDVQPKSGNLLTVVGAFTGGPVGAAVGAAANAVLGKPLGEIGARTYKVSGPWKEPKVEVVGREQSRSDARDEEREPPAAAPAPTPAPESSSAPVSAPADERR